MEDVVHEFVAEAREGIEALDSKLVRFEQTPDDPALLGEIFRLIHSMKCASGFLGLSRLQAVAHAAEDVLGLFRDGQLAVDAASVSAILDAVDVVRTVIEGLADAGIEPAGDDAELVARLNAIAVGGSAAPADDGPPLLERLGGEATLDAACESAMVRLRRAPATASLFACADPDRIQAAWRTGLMEIARGQTLPDAFRGVLAETLPGVAADQARDVEAALRDALGALEAEADAVERLLAPIVPPTAPLALEEAAPVEPVRGAGGASCDATRGPQTIRVGVETLEGLMTMVSELVLIRNQLIQTLRDQPETPFAGPLNRLNQVTSELQEGVMTTRMQPIGGAWSKLPRLVRDLASELGKRIDLVMSGEDTELDRQVMELIRDPLTHMVRNACDHGLEPPADRRAAGKPETGRIQLSARHEGGAILIEMADDGRGLSPARLRDKAVANGLITPGEAGAMSDAEARSLIFRPGFSTAREVTAISGRGVGMDVVRTNIEAIGGAVELSSVEGRGARFTICISLTLSIIAGLVVESCGQRFAMPQAGIVELVNANGAAGRRIERINGAEVLRLRDRLLPLVSLQAVLGLEAPDEPREEACIVVARVGTFDFGVVVDRVFDTEEIVVKPVASILRHLRLYSGATILGDGSVIMILDFKGMSVEAGAAEVAADSLLDDGPEALAATGERREALLVFRAPDQSLKAAPLARVARIEEMRPDALEWADGRSLLQYRGRLTPILGLDGEPVSAAPDGKRPLLVVTRGDASLGLMVEEIVDIVDVATITELDGASIGVTGSLVVAGRATELVDIDFYWRRAAREAEPAGVPAAMSASRRLLVVDQSPFTRLLLGPLLAQAGYRVEVAADPETALALHDAGEAFDLILTDTSPQGDQARRMAEVFARADAWHATPLLGLGAQRTPSRQEEGDRLLAEVAEALDDLDEQEAA